MKIHPWAIALGFITGVGLEVVVGIFTAVAGLNLIDSGPALFALIISLFISVFAGYVTSLKSPTSKYFNVAIVVVIFLVMDLLLIYYVTANLAPWWYHIGGLIFGTPAPFLGAYLQQRKRA